MIQSGGHGKMCHCLEPWACADLPYPGISVKDGSVFESGSSWSRDGIEWIRGRLDRFTAAVDE